MLPPQPDANRLYGYHGTASARGGRTFLWTLTLHVLMTRFLARGYQPLTGTLTSEYASLNIGKVSNTPETRVTPKDLRVIQTDQCKPVGNGFLVILYLPALFTKLLKANTIKCLRSAKGEDIYGEPMAKVYKSF